MDMQVVILAAGRGRRFIDAGYTAIKPLIPVCGKPLLSYALRQAYAVSSTPVVLFPSGHGLQVHNAMEAYTAALTTKRLEAWWPPRPELRSVKYTQAGAACTLLAAAAALDEDKPVLVMDCDTIIAPEIIAGFAAASLEAFVSGAESALLCFNSTDNSEQWSFVDVDPLEPMRLTVREKVRISNIATAGVHAFKSWVVLRTALCRLISDHVTYNGEYYLAPVHNGLRAVVRMMPETAHHPVGTPEQLKAYEDANGLQREEGVQ